MTLHALRTSPPAPLRPGRLGTSAARWLAVACLAAAGCGKVADSVRSAVKASGATTAAAKVAETNWPPERISKVPAGYLACAQKQIEAQIAEREKRLNTLEARKREITTRSSALAGKLQDVQNVHDRLAAACRRADDEDRWPAKVGGREFDKAKAQSIIESSERYVQDYRPLVDAYADAVHRLEATEAALKGDLYNLGRLREKTEIDMERIQINQGIAELGDLKQREAELASFSTTIADMSGDAAIGSDVLNRKPADNIDVDSLLK